MSRTRNATSLRVPELANITQQLSELATLPSRALAEKYLAVMGEPTRSNNRAWMLRTIAWRLQEQADVGLSERAQARITELGDELPVAWRMRQAPLAPEIAALAPLGPSEEVPAARDPRLPPAGTVITRSHGGVDHQVVVHEVGFEYRGRSYKSLSQVAKAITGTTWNGFHFFKAALTAVATANGTVTA